MWNVPDGRESLSYEAPTLGTGCARISGICWLKVFQVCDCVPSAGEAFTLLCTLAAQVYMATSREYCHSSMPCWWPFIGVRWNLKKTFPYVLSWWLRMLRTLKRKNFKMYLITYLCVFVCVHMSIGTRGIGPWSWRSRQLCVTSYEHWELISGTLPWARNCWSTPNPKLMSTF